jgi:hypothetical protein
VSCTPRIERLHTRPRQKDHSKEVLPTRCVKEKIQAIRRVETPSRHAISNAYGLLTFHEHSHPASRTAKAQSHLDFPMEPGKECTQFTKSAFRSLRSNGQDTLHAASGNRFASVKDSPHYLFCKECDLRPFKLLNTTSRGRSFANALAVGDELEDSGFCGGLQVRLARGARDLRQEQQLSSLRRMLLSTFFSHALRILPFGALEPCSCHETMDSLKALAFD